MLVGLRSLWSNGEGSRGIANWTVGRRLALVRLSVLDKLQREIQVCPWRLEVIYGLVMWRACDINNSKSTTKLRLQYIKRLRHCHNLNNCTHIVLTKAITKSYIQEDSYGVSATYGVVSVWEVGGKGLRIEWSDSVHSLEKKRECLKIIKTYSIRLR